MSIHDYIQQIPKAELHVHLEGTLEPEFIFELAKRNNIELEYKTPEDVVAAYDFYDLPSFLKIYYAGMNVLQTEQDFYDLAYQYFQKAAAQNVLYVEPFFDPQGHTTRGVEFDTLIKGIHRAQLDARANLGIESNLIMCFLRDMSAESAAEHLEMVKPYLDWVIGVGLDSDEKDNPPSKFAKVFADARSMGLKLTMHCDVNQKDILSHIDECLNLIEVDRIDHGINCLEDEYICEQIAKKGIGLTVCPVSNRVVAQTLTGDEIKLMLKKNIKATINSDDPAYFRAYLKENFQALADEASFTKSDIQQLTRNAFEVSWLDDSRKEHYVNQLMAININ